MDAIVVVTAGPRAPLIHDARAMTRRWMKMAVKYPRKASTDLSTEGEIGMHPWKMKMKMKRLTRSLGRSDYSHEIRSYLLLVRYKLRYDPDADTKLDTFDGRRFPGGVPGTVRPPGEEPQIGRAHV